MNLQQYRESRMRGPISSGVRQRWQERIVAQRMRGAAGADTYLSRYGKGIKAPKVIELARMAESQGDQPMADRFWAVAYKLETGQAPQDGNEAATEDAPAAPQKAASVPRSNGRRRAGAAPLVSAFPDDPGQQVTPAAAPAYPFPVAPGELVTMQPVDAPHERDYYVRSPRYWGQPKVYGHRMVVFATENKVWYQARSLNLWPAPSEEMDRALRRAAEAFGPFILDGEKFYRDCTGAERMTAAQAATVNVREGQAGFPTDPIYAIFRCLYAMGDDLRGGDDEERLKYAGHIGLWLKDNYPGVIEVLPVATTEAEKAALVTLQAHNNREGEVWFQPFSAYVGGKGHKIRGELATVRTKYKQTFDVFVTGLEPTTVAGKAFSSMRVAVFCDGQQVDLGRVGTGFTQSQTHEIRNAFERGGLVVEITTQRFTENRAVVHGSYVRMRPDKQPTDCVVDTSIF